MRNWKTSFENRLWGRECECRGCLRRVGEKGLADAAIKYRVSSPGGAEDSSGLLVLPRVGRVIDDTGRWF